MNRVLLITEEPILASGLAAELRAVSEIELDIAIGIPSAINDLVKLKDPDVLLFDFIPEQYPVLVELRSAVPLCKIVLWMRTVPVEVGCRTMQLGVRGILKKTAGVDLVVKCLERIAAGEFWFDQEATAGFLESRTVPLTPRESQIVPLVAQGLKNKDIAATLNLAESTIRIYLSTLFRKLGVNDRYELAIFGMRNIFPGQAGAEKMEHVSATPGTSRMRHPVLPFMVMDRPPVGPAGEVRKNVVVRPRHEEQAARRVAIAGAGRWA